MASGLEHVVLHLGLCSAVARAGARATVAMRVQMQNRVGDPVVDRTFEVERGDGSQAVVEYDVPRGTYRLRVDVPAYRCATADYLDILADRSRRVSETLADGPPAAPAPVVLMDGEAPVTFLYTKPTFVFFDKSVACDAPIGTPLPVRTAVEYDQGAYHAWLYTDVPASTSTAATPANAASASSSPSSPPLSPSASASTSTSTSSPASGAVVVALRLRTPTGSAHYVRVPISFPQPWGGWPSNVQMNVTEDMIDNLATDKTDTLLCPKFWRTSAG